jgi:putative protease
MEQAHSMHNTPEVLSPAGDWECFRAAVDFGANAVYLAGRGFGMRSAPKNFGPDELHKAVDYAHGKGVRVYVTCNTLPRNAEFAYLPAFLEHVADAGADALIVTDLGVLAQAKRYAPQMEIHISTQAGVVNYMAARALYDLGAARVVLARELNLEEIAEIRTKTPRELALEAFVHGSMCVSFSGRCLISNYLTGRDANRGACTQPCRWKYYLTEEKRPGEYFPVVEEPDGTYFFNSRDLCMIEHIPQLVSAGISSLKIEGRAKAAYYVAVTSNAYRHAVDDYIAVGNGWILPQWIREEVYKISHREYTTGFYLGGNAGQVYGNGGYVREYEVAAVCEDYRDGRLCISQRNRFFRGETLEVLEPCGVPFPLTVEALFDEEGNPVESAPHATQKLYIPSARPVAPGAILRRKKEEA